jgi:hypothetical protein
MPISACTVKRLNGQEKPLVASGAAKGLIDVVVRPGPIGSDVGKRAIAARKDERAFRDDLLDLAREAVKLPRVLDLDSLRKSFALRTHDAFAA